MLIRILGSAAGGGFPQWNCNCSGCQAARRGEQGIYPRTQSSLAVRGSSGDWFLVNASPDVRQQLEQLRDEIPNSVRSSPIAGVLLSDGEIDHTAGLMILRESAQPLQVYGTATVRQALTEGFSLLRVLKDYCGVKWSVVEPSSPINLSSNGESSLEVEAFLLPGTPPKYMRSVAAAGDWVVGFTFREQIRCSEGDRVNNSVVTYAPALAELTPSILARFESSDCILVDGTFWQNDELLKLGSTRTALEMGHLPLSGDDGSLIHLSQLACARKIFIHINNTNPILIPNSQERQMVEAAGMEIGYDGLTIEL
jgi:pyrroloquinoline quinone biosynthesis protein B